MKNKKSRGDRPEADFHMNSEQVMRKRTELDVLKGKQDTLDQFAEKSGVEQKEEADRDEVKLSEYE